MSRLRNQVASLRKQVVALPREPSQDPISPPVDTAYVVEVLEGLAELGVLDDPPESCPEWCDGRGGACCIRRWMHEHDMTAEDITSGAVRRAWLGTGAQEAST